MTTIRALARRRRAIRLKHQRSAGRAASADIHKAEEFALRAEAAWQRYLRDGQCSPIDDEFDRIDKRIDAYRSAMELTREAAAELLHVSVTHLDTLAASGALGLVRRSQDGHYRLSKAVLLKYKSEDRERQSRGLAAMVAASHTLGLYDDELAGHQVPPDL